jgi:branched-chain amino acid transport system permease protein
VDLTILAPQIANGVSLGMTYAVVAIGFGLTFSVMRVINLAHPDLMLLGAYATYVAAQAIRQVAPGLHPILAFVVLMGAALVTVLIATIILERLVIRRLRYRSLLVTFIATAGVAIAIENGIQIVFGPDPVGIGSVIPVTIFSIQGVNFTSAQVLVVATALAVLGMILWYVRRTRLGLQTRALAESPEVAAAFGIDVTSVARKSLAVAAAGAGAAGVAIALLFQSASPVMALTFGPKSFICMLVAGNRSLTGILLVGLSLGIVEALITGYISSNYRDLITYSVLIAILFIRPRGLFGSYDIPER